MVAGELREQIVDGALEDGSELPTIDALVDRFGVSSPSVREALRILESEGLITVRRGNVGGSVVHAPEARRAGYMLGLVLQSEHVAVGDVAGSLAHLLALCAGLAARRPHRRRDVVPPLRRAHEACEAEIDASAEDFEAASRGFHQEIVRQSGNRTLGFVIGTLESLWRTQEEAWARRIADARESPDPSLRREGIDAHARVLDAISRGDSAEAASLMTEHALHPEVYGLRDPGKHSVRATNLAWADEPRGASLP